MALMEVQEMDEQAFETRFDELVSQYRWAVAITKEMIEEVGKERALAVASRAIVHSQKEYARDLADKYGATFDGFRTWLREEARGVGSMEILKEGENFVATRFARCPAFEALKLLGLPELCDVYCDSDYAFAKAFSPHLRLERTKTIAGGDDCCDHAWHWEA